MIAERETGMTVEGNITGKQYRSGIDDENMAHIISLFTDLYSDPMLAVIREYSTNAYDAQVEAGVKRPIEVSTPTPLSPFFKVKDFGVGLSGDDIGRIYSRYGTSTKRATNDQNGMLGLGCKSALTYTQQFSVESVKDGRKMICSISREEDGVPVMTVVAEADSDEENGTTVIVPVQRGHFPSFEDKAKEFYGYWREGTVLLNGKPAKRHDGLRLSDTILLRRMDRHDYSRRALRIVMGNVSYPVDMDQSNVQLPVYYNAVVEVPIGSVDFTPSRESLMYTRRTKETLSQITNDAIRALIEKAVQKQISDAKTPAEAIQAVMDAKPLLGQRSCVWQFKGRDLPTTLPGTFHLSAKNSARPGESQLAWHGLDMSYVTNAVFVTGYNPAKFTAQHKRKLNQYVADNNLGDDFLYYALTDDTLDTTWIKPERIIKWEDVRAIKLPVAPRQWTNGRPTGAYDAFVGNIPAKHIQADEIDTSKPLYYARGLNKNQAKSFAELIITSYPDATVVCLPENRVDKFKRNFPTAKPHNEALKSAHKKWYDQLTKQQRHALMLHDNSRWSFLRMLAPVEKEIKDPKLREAVRTAGQIQIDPLLKRRTRFSHILHVVAAEQLPKDWECPLTNYPLAVDVGTYSGRHLLADMVIYLNAKYEDR